VVPKRVNLVPNLRLDIVDLEQQTAGLSIEGDKQYVERAILARRAAVVEGFRTRITAPKTLSVYNGIAFDRDGQILNNEEDTAARRDITLPGNGTFYVEVEFVTSESSVDARGFWDPSFDNGIDPSGDPRPRGREFVENIATRITPDWHIVSPVSTTGFASTTDPTSTRIPIARIVVSGGVVVASQVSLGSVTAEAITTTSTRLAVFNTREMPDTGEVTIDPTSVVPEILPYVANDRDNNILTLGSLPASDRVPGVRVIVVGTPTYLTEGGIDPGTGSFDARARLFQGDAARGQLLGLDPLAALPADVDTRSDVQVTSEKRYKDFIAAQIQELKFGGAHRGATQHGTQVGVTPPPVRDFTESTRYYDFAGGVLGARTNTLSMGDGVTSWGDLNVSEFTDADACMQAVLSRISEFNGGTVFVKHGLYQFQFLHTIDSNFISFVGESQGAVFVAMTTNPIFHVTAAGGLTLRSITLQSNDLVTPAIEFVQGSKFYCYDSSIDGVRGEIGPHTTVGFRAGHVINSTFGSVPSPLAAKMTDVAFEGCTIQTPSTSCVSGALLRVSFRDTAFVGASTTAYLIDSPAVNHCVLDRCSFSGAGSISATATFTSINNCSFLFDGNNTKSINLHTIAIGIHIEGCRFEQTAFVVSSSSVGVFIQQAFGCTVSNNTWVAADVGLRLQGATDTLVSGNEFSGGGGQNFYQTAIDLYSTGADTAFNRVSIVDNSFSDYTADLGENKCIATWGDTPPVLRSIHVNRNKFQDIGAIGGNRSVATCVDFNYADSGEDIVINNNTFRSLTSPAYCFGIRVTNVSNVVVHGNSFTGLCQSGTTQIEWNAIRTKDCDGVSVCGNTIQNAGHAAVGSFINLGLIQVGIASGSGVSRNNVTVANNVLRLIYPNRYTAPSQLSAGILLDNIGAISAVTGNSIDFIAAGVGILVRDEDTGTANPRIYGVTITGNSVNGNSLVSSSGILVQWLRAEATTFIGGRCTITGNSVIDCANGISVSCNTSQPPRGLVISSNVVTAEIDLGASGIFVSGMRGFSIHGNQVSLDTLLTTSGNGIYVIGSQGTVSGNAVTINSNSAASNCIHVGQTTQTTVTGNTCIFGSTGTIGSVGIVSPPNAVNVDQCLIVGNTVIAAVTGSGGLPIVKFGTSTPTTAGTKAYRNEDHAATTAPSDPSGNTDIGLNLRLT
jgi:hypothetical protein